MIYIYLILFDNGIGPEPLGGYLTIEEAEEIMAEMNDNNPDTEHWIVGPVEVDPDNRVD
jgi:hypothetical protein